jgi:hypothetical protein
LNVEEEEIVKGAQAIAWVLRVLAVLLAAGLVVAAIRMW